MYDEKPTLRTLLLILMILSLLITTGCTGDDGEDQNAEERAYEQFEKNNGYPQVSGFEVKYRNGTDHLNIGVRTRGDFTGADFRFTQNGNVVERHELYEYIHNTRASLDIYNFTDEGLTMEETMEVELTVENSVGTVSTLRTGLFPSTYFEWTAEPYTFINMYNGYDSDTDTNNIGIELRHNDLLEQYSVNGTYALFDHKGDPVVSGYLYFIEDRSPIDKMGFTYAGEAKDGDQYKPFRIIISRTISSGDEDLITIDTEAYFCPYAANG